MRMHNTNFTPEQRSMRVAASLWSVPRPDHVPTLDRLSGAGVGVVHWDMTDGEFAASGGFKADEARELSNLHNFRAEAHLMVTRPNLEIDAWTDFCEMVVVHAESLGWQDAIRRIEARGTRPALALSPGTPSRVVTSKELAVLVMSITPGQAGSSFNRAAFNTVEEVSQSRRLVGLDGGVTATLGQEARLRGANWLVSGTDLCGASDPKLWLELTGGDHPESPK